MSHVTLVSHDAGGAEILSSWLKRNNYSASVVATGPALKIFKKKCPKAEYINLDEALQKSDWLLSGTGWQTNFEIEAIIEAQKKNIKTVSFLDHWVNYRERFEKNGKMYFPDEIWVGDRDAENLAKKVFFQIPVLLKQNPYFEDLIEEIEKNKIIKSDISNKNILYICEPIAEHALSKHGDENFWGYTEHDALDFFLKNLSTLNQSEKNIIIRPHPSEKKSKYKWIEHFKNLNIKFGGKKTLLQEITESDIIVGCESMAMVVALLAKKRVICSIPFGGRSCQLPHNDIEHLQNLIKS